MPVRLNGSTSGYTELSAPATAGNNTLTLPTGNGTADQTLVTNGSGTLSWADRGRLVLSTAQNTTSGTSIDFTGIPSWVKRITVMFSGVSTNGSSNIQIQIGTSAGLETSGYASTAWDASTVNATSGFVVSGSVAAANVRSGAMVLTTLGGNAWVNAGVLCRTESAVGAFASGAKTLSGTLDRVRITTVNGTDTFDAGSANILYEG